MRGSFLELIGAAWMLGFVASCSGPVPVPTHDWAYDDSLATRSTLEQLARPIDFSITEVPAKQALELWRAAAGVNLRVHWAALEANGVADDQLISADFHSTPAGIVLDVLTKTELGGIDPGTVWSVEDGIVIVSTKRHATTALRVYDIRDLIEGPGGDEAREKRIEEITAVIMDTPGVRYPDEHYPIESSTLRELNGRLYIRTTWREHREIENLLAALRRKS